MWHYPNGTNNVSAASGYVSRGTQRFLSEYRNASGQPDFLCSLTV